MTTTARLGHNSSAMSTIIETKALCKSYGVFGALRGVDITVPQGSVFALLGASGAGKTTLIKILMNLLRPSSGSAMILGRDAGSIDAHVLSGIGYVSENQAMPLRLRVSEFFDYLRPCYARWDVELERQLREQMRLPPARRIGELSHGMRLKMALACALPFRPQLLILDEPLSGLDALARDEIIAGFLHRTDPMTIVISSHELDEVERFATHVAFLHEGRALFQGSVNALAEHARPLLPSPELRQATQRSLRDIFVAMVRHARQDVIASAEPRR
jgi:ABC-2 type transport system ATP-binding protein